MEETIAACIYERATRALASLPVDERRDTYVVSFFVYDHRDDPRRPVLTIGTNTERQVARVTHTASDEAEARWNYAFWLQNDLATVGGPLDPDGERLVKAAFDTDGLWFADDDYSDRALDIGRAMTRRFVSECLTAAQRMHQRGVIVATFGRPIPVLVHELEYYDELVQQNRGANPPELVNELAAWVESS